MKEYYEATETVEENPEFIRSDVTGMTEQEKADVQAAIEDVMSGKHYRLMAHYCYHDENGACSMELIKET